MNRGFSKTRLIAIIVGAGMLLWPGIAGATYHTYRFEEVYSNPSGTIQFIELHESFGFNGQNQESEAPDIFAGGAGNIGNPAHDLTLANLPSTTTAGTDFLLGTAGYDAIPGAPKADFLIPSDFFNPNGDTLQYGQGVGNPHPGPDGAVDTITFGALPSNLSEALQRVGTSGSTFITGPAIANTFSSGGGFAVPEPTAVGLLSLGAIQLLARRRHTNSI